MHYLTNLWRLIVWAAALSFVPLGIYNLYIADAPGIALFIAVIILVIHFYTQDQLKSEAKSLNEPYKPVNYKKYVRYTLYGMGILILVLIITNPSLKDFKDRVGVISYNKLFRLNNFFVCSVYYYEGGKYLALAGNFIRIH